MPLHFAAENGNRKHQKEEKCQNNHFTCFPGSIETTKILIEAGADVNAIHSWLQKTPLHDAAQQGERTTVNAPN